MVHYLLVYDRPRGRLLREEAFEDEREALTERFRVERLHRADPDIEVVVLSAPTKEALRRTHARYFMSVGEMAADWLRQLDAEAL
ncbi:MAG TPA: hypothetical protein VFQ85_02630 [Mycobacteriales bacterium]|jgi:hypothetical protein|nr:hypothetical protein [Mycobacteriales bacterium]